MTQRSYHVRSSTLNSLDQYEYKSTGETLQVGNIIKLTNTKTGKSKNIRIEYIRKTKEGYVIKNVNNTLFLKQK